jgi:hypothetical protein
MMGNNGIIFAFIACMFCIVLTHSRNPSPDLNYELMEYIMINDIQRHFSRESCICYIVLCSRRKRNRLQHSLNGNILCYLFGKYFELINSMIDNVTYITETSVKNDTRFYKRDLSCDKVVYDTIYLPRITRHKLVRCENPVESSNQFMSKQGPMNIARSQNYCKITCDQYYFSCPSENLLHINQGFYVYFGYNYIVPIEICLLIGGNWMADTFLTTSDLGVQKIDLTSHLYHYYKDYNLPTLIITDKTIFKKSGVAEMYRLQIAKGLFRQLPPKIVNKILNMTQYRLCHDNIETFNSGADYTDDVSVVKYGDVIETINGDKVPDFISVKRVTTNLCEMIEIKNKITNGNVYIGEGLFSLKDGVTIIFNAHKYDYIDILNLKIGAYIMNGRFYQYCLSFETARNLLLEKYSFLSDEALAVQLVFLFNTGITLHNFTFSSWDKFRLVEYGTHCDCRIKNKTQMLKLMAFLKQKGLKTKINYKGIKVPYEMFERDFEVFKARMPEYRKLSHEYIKASPIRTLLKMRREKFHNDNQDLAAKNNKAIAYYKTAIDYVNNDNILEITHIPKLEKQFDNRAIIKYEDLMTDNYNGPSRLKAIKDKILTISNNKIKELESFFYVYEFEVVSSSVVKVNKPHRRYRCKGHRRECPKHFREPKWILPFRIAYLLPPKKLFIDQPWVSDPVRLGHILFHNYNKKNNIVGGNLKRKIMKLVLEGGASHNDKLETYMKKLFSRKTKNLYQIIMNRSKLN